MKRLLYSALFLVVSMVAVWYVLPAESAEPVPKDITITLVIEPANMLDIEASLKGLFPIPMVKDPEDEDQQIPQYTDREWVSQCLDKFFQTSKLRWDTKLNNDAKAERVSRNKTLIKSITVGEASE